ncbi:MAG: Dam family site-specific DNA-(adenine-N6)-methyltransferase [Proteobacteria bacterium]|nr:Dam family site-specific DNA-(adenine-N6)-methyltransferase [Pseudomonadota bacterium]
MNDTIGDEISAQRPFLKWAGGKFQIVDKIRLSLPQGNRLIEPFVGAGSVFLNTSFEQYVLNDINQDLIGVFNILKQEKERFIGFVKELFGVENNSRSRFIQLRDKFNLTDDLRLKSALFIYLNRHAYNGLMRYNQSGQFNTSFGDYKKPYFPDSEMLAFAKRLNQAKLYCGDFEQVMSMAKKGDVVYCDPPYVPLSVTANFTKYQGEGFGLNEQERLVLKAKELAKKGIPVIISNHDTEFVQKLYKGADISSFDVQRYISRQGNNRKKVRELIAVFE